jgi:hypothetical protein
MNSEKKYANPNIYPSSRILKRMGFYKDQDGIVKRYIEEAGNWRTHLENTKNFIREVLQNSNAKTISVLGSGWMLDVPVAFLAENFDQIIFYDLRHSQQIKHRYRNQPNFHLKEIDLSGGLIEKIYNLCNQRKKPDLIALRKELQVPVLKLPVETDYTISLNILNQLDILIVDYLKRNIEITEVFADNLRQYIQTNHLNLLQAGKSCLIADFEEVTTENSGKELNRVRLIHANLPKEIIQKTWIWHFDTRMTYNPGCCTFFNVMAAEF